MVTNLAALVLFVVWFLVIFVIRSVLQKRATGDSGIRTGGLTAGASAIETVAGWLLVAALVAGVAAPIAAIAGLAMVIDSDPARIIGLVVAVAGILVTFLAQVAMGSEWRIGIDKTESTGLVTGGVFAIVRNPIFSAMIITAIGFALLVPNAIAFAAVVLLVLAIELQVRYVEEPHLRELHGHHYSDYAATVGRFLPVMGRNTAPQFDDRATS